MMARETHQTSAAWAWLLAGATGVILMSIRLAFAAAGLLAALPAQAVETSLQLQLSADQDFERRTVVYDCGSETPLSVTYLNAAPNFLAIVPVEGENQPLVFAAVLSGSGARYASGPWLWESQGPDARLYDVAEGEDAAAVLTCSEMVNTP
jgi:membrane-bound inhibitor of C-type lysozyme